MINYSLKKLRMPLKRLLSPPIKMQIKQDFVIYVFTKFLPVACLYMLCLMSNFQAKLKDRLKIIFDGFLIDRA